LNIISTKYRNWHTTQKALQWLWSKRERRLQNTICIINKTYTAVVQIRLSLTPSDIEFTTWHYAKRFSLANKKKWINTYFTLHWGVKVAPLLSSLSNDDPKTENYFRDRQVRIHWRGDGACRAAFPLRTSGFEFMELEQRKWFLKKSFTRVHGRPPQDRLSVVSGRGFGYARATSRRDFIRDRETVLVGNNNPKHTVVRCQFLGNYHLLKLLAASLCCCQHATKGRDASVWEIEILWGWEAGLVA